MRAVLLLVAVLLAFCASPVYSQGGSSICGRYTTALFGTDTPANEVSLMTAIVTRAVQGGVVTNAGTTYYINGLFNSSGPLYNIFSGITQYRTGAPNYTDTTSANFQALAGHLTSYFGALFGCQVGATGGLAPVHTSDMYGVHQNMYINNNMETYFNTALATTLTSFGVSSADLTTAGYVLSLFNRYGAPIQPGTVGNNYISNSTSNGLTQVCGDSSCPNAPTANAALYPSGASTVQVSVGLIAALIAVVSVLAL